MLHRDVLAYLQDAEGGIGIDTSGEALVPGTLEDARLTHVAGTDGHVHILRALRVHQVIVLREARLVGSLLPVGVRYQLSLVSLGPVQCGPFGIGV